MQVEEELAALGLSAEASLGIIEATKVGSLVELEGLLGAGNEAVEELQQLFSLAEGYGYADYLQLDTSCVRGLAYYTGALGPYLKPKQTYPNCETFISPSLSSLQPP